jgi:hypothetical protein
VAMTWILIAAMWRQHAHRAVDGVLAVLVATITVAPLFVKQHVLFDVVLGVPWGLASYWAAKRLYERLRRSVDSARGRAGATGGPEALAAPHSALTLSG